MGVTKNMFASSALLFFAILSHSLYAHAANRDALWNIVNTQCVPDQITNGNPQPCTYVSLKEGQARGYVVLKDLVGNTQFLVIPTEKITGIEDPLLRKSKAPNYWEAAWEATSDVIALAHKPLSRDMLGLEVNSMGARTQDQLHIHVDCLNQDFRTLLKQHEAEISSRWDPYHILYQGEFYRVRKIQGEDLSKSDPFKLLARDLGGDASLKIGYHTLIVAGAIFANGQHGFYILDNHYYPDESDHTAASGENALDHSCVLAQ